MWPEQNDSHFADGIFKCIFLIGNYYIFLWSLLPRVQLTISQHCFKSEFGAGWQQAIPEPMLINIHDSIWQVSPGHSELIKSADIIMSFIDKRLLECIKVLLTIFSCDQAALQMVFSVCSSVRPSVCLSVTPFWLCSHHRIIMKFSGVITKDRRKVHAKGQGQRSKVKVTEVTTQLNRFGTVTPVWIPIWRWNDAYGLMLLRRGALLFFKVILQISRSHRSKNRQIWPRFGVSGL